MGRRVEGESDEGYESMGVNCCEHMYCDCIAILSIFFPSHFCIFLSFPPPLCCLLTFMDSHTHSSTGQGGMLHLWGGRGKGRERVGGGGGERGWEGRWHKGRETVERERERVGRKSETVRG
jgi:hypothetical protein